MLRKTINAMFEAATGPSEAASPSARPTKTQRYAVTPPHKPADLAATIYHALGIDHEMRLPDAQGRPVGLMDDGQPIMELFG